MKFSFILMVSIILVAGCVQQEEVSIKEVSIPGHNDIYTFTNDLRESLQVAADDPQEIRQKFFSGSMNLVFDGSSQQDNAYFTVIMTNIMAKIPIYLAYEGVLMEFQPYYFVENVWYDRSGNEIEKPALTGPTLWLRGPATGAENVSLSVTDNNITLQGTSYKELTLAADKLVLIVMDISSIP